ncbi:hypothetical protein BH23ACT9_BH23ACT9_16500 [soil metagenome]
MCTTYPDTNPADVLLGIDDLQVRYRCGRTKAFNIAGEDSFPNSVTSHTILIPLIALRAWELATAVAGTVAEPKPPTVIAPPAAKSAGRPATVRRS